jgi:ADP-heptose:LPS heptosyltransferase
MIRNQNYDLVVDFFGNPRSALMTYLSGAKNRVGYNFRFRQRAYTKVVPSRANVIHEAEWHLDALTHLDIPIVSRKLNFEVGEGSKNFANNFWQQADLTGKRVIALNFSGGWPAKRWPTDRFAHLADILMELYSARIILTWGPGEREAAEKLQEQVVGPTLLIPEANLKQLAAILQRADILITTDSGPMHVAAAMGTPCVALFGPTNAKLQGPYGSFHKIVQAEGLDCLGCNRLKCDHISCMTLITVSDVLTAVKQTIAENDLFTSLT